MKFVTQIEYDDTTDEYILPIPEELADSLGWDVGDTLQWEYNDDSILLRKADV
jgi:bifunctional DNA-binding transcriptional regulator/antitoxin component of YhaV-PrlF toxin-antitoxin module